MNSLPTPYYSHDGVTIYCADNRNILPLLDPCGLLLTDPPYGTTASEWDTVPDLDWFWRVAPVTKDGAVVATCSQPFTSQLVCSNLKAFKHEWIWRKNRASNFLSARFQPLKTHESVVVFCRGKLSYNPQITDGHAPVNFARRKANSSTVYGMHKEQVNEAGDTTRYPTSVLDFKCLDNCSPERRHPNQKPVALFDYLCATYASPGTVVLDPWMGSGTTLVAAKQRGLQAIGIERNERDCAYAVERLRQGILLT